MLRQRGFTIVEVVVVLTIMGILLGLGMLSIQSSQGNARNQERLNDIDQIMRGLESYYNSSTSGGKYPDTTMTTTTLDIYGVKQSAYTYAHTSTQSFAVTTASAGYTPVENITNTSAGLATVDKFIYEPATFNASTNVWSVCGAGQDCMGYTIYYKLEGNAAVQMKHGVHR